MTLWNELATAERACGADRHLRLARVLIEAAVAAPATIHGQRAGDWGPLFASVVARLSLHDARNALQALSLLPAIPASLAPTLIDLGAVELLERMTLDQGQLCALARRAPPDQLAALAQRPDLPVQASNLVVARGGSHAHAALARNRSARIGASCFGTLAELAVADRALKEALVARPDLPAQLLDKLWPYLSVAAKRAAIAAAPAQLSQRLAALMGEDAAPVRERQKDPCDAAPKAAKARVKVA